MEQEPFVSVVIETLYDASLQGEPLNIKAGAVGITHEGKRTLLYFWEAWEIVEMLNLAIGMLSSIAMTASILSKVKVQEDLLVEIVAQSLFVTRMEASKAKISAEITTQGPWVAIKYNDGPMLGLTLGEARMHALALSTSAAGISGSIALARTLAEKGVTDDYIQNMFENVGRARDIMEMEIMSTGQKLYKEEGKNDTVYDCYSAKKKIQIPISAALLAEASYEVCKNLRLDSGNTFIRDCIEEMIVERIVERIDRLVNYNLPTLITNDDKDDITKPK
jgi:hypothetical protein